MFSISLILLLIIASQWLAWRFKLPAIVLLTLCGLLLGPFTGFIRPEVILGDHWTTIVSLSVALILFDGGLNLSFYELTDTRRAALQLIWLGAPLSAALNTLAAHYLAGLSWPTAGVFGCILIVTGPTVIIPLLRQTRLSPRTASLLKWEGIFNDPKGVLLAVLAFEYFTNVHKTTWMHYLFQGADLGLIVVGSWAITKALVWIFVRGLVPDYLKSPMVLAFVITTFVVTNWLHDEGGLVGVTIMGITMANSRLPSIEELRRFKEVVSLLLVSLIFILTTATLTPDTLHHLGLRDALFILCILFVTRPLTVWVGTVGSGLGWRERLLIGWIAPRGVVCAVISGFFGHKLLERGIGDGARMVPLAFSVVFATILAHGFTLRPLAERLGLAANRNGGLLIIGCSAWSVELAKLAAEKNVTIKIVDHHWRRLRLAREEKLDVYYGNLLLQSHHKLDLHEYTHLLAATDDFAFNGLLCAKFSHEFERNNVFQITGDIKEENGPSMLYPHLFGRPFMVGIEGDMIAQRMSEGWAFKAVNLTDNFSFDDYLQEHGEAIPSLYITVTGIFKLVADTAEVKRLRNVTLISLVAPKVCALPEPTEKGQVAVQD